MTVEDFLLWLDDQPELPRHELVDGVPVAMAPECIAHARLKGEVWLAFRNAIRDQGLPCEALPDGVAVQIHDMSLYQPDVVIHCGERLDDAAVLVPEPVVVVEVLSPSTQHVDTGRKLAGYFGLPSVIHDLIVPTDRRAIIHHRRGDGEEIIARILTDGTLEIDPLGFTLELGQIYGQALR